jgi:hypothetical protein
VEPLEYFQYDFPHKSRFQRHEFVTYYHLRRIMSQVNQAESRWLLDDKAEFCRRFGDCLGREWLDMVTASSDDFIEFGRRHPVFFHKLSDSMFGKGVRREHMPDDRDAIINLRARLRECPSILEEPIAQHQALAAFNATSVNTIRVVTLVDSHGVPHVVSCVLRLGRNGRSVDNFHFGGIAASIDIHSGCVASSGIDADWNRYTRHPDSDLKIIGFTVPMWDDVLSLARTAAVRIPDIRLAGWDIAITETGAVIVEGNYGPDPDVTQMPQDRGLLPQMLSILSL